uniref:Cuticular protein RR-2 motif n=1 Tax=Triatoma infestans TaxID=30076 RepID=A0A161MJL6_TRIIF
MFAKLLVVLGMTLGVAVGGLYDGLGFGHGGSLGYASHSVVAAPAVAVTKVAAAPVVAHGYGGGFGGFGGGFGRFGGYGHAAPVAVAHAAPVVAHAAPVAVAAHAKHVVDYVDTHPAYQFEYSVHDAHTGDVKHQSESRDGDVVHGSYSLVEPDGSKRVVEYTADPHNGFNAVVHREHNAHPQVLHKVAVAAPVAVKAAPLLSHY